MNKLEFFILNETNIKFPYEITSENSKNLNIKYFNSFEQMLEFCEEEFVQPDFILILNSPNILKISTQIKEHFNIFITNSIIIYDILSKEEKYHLLKNGFIYFFEYKGDTYEFNYMLEFLIKKHIKYLNTLDELNELNKRTVELMAYYDELEYAKDTMEEQAGELAYALVEVEEAKQIIEKQKAKIEDDLKKASLFQLSLLPSDSDINNNEFLKINYYYKPSVQLSGDFFDLYQKDNDSYILLIADVMGHGTQSALVSTTIKVAFREIVKNYYKPGEILTILNSQLYEILNKAEIYFTALCCYIDLSLDMLIIANAGHHYPVPINIEVEENILKKNTSIFIGVLESTFYNNMKLKLSNFQELLFYTDGIIEAQNEKKEQYGKKRLTDIFLKYKYLEPEIINQKIIQDLQSFTNTDSFDDDLTLIALKTIINEF